MRKGFLWQRTLLVFCGLAFATAVLSATSNTIMSDSARGFQLEAHPGNVEAIVSYVVPGGPAARSGLHAGDVVLLSRVSSAERWRLSTGVRAHEHLDIPIVRSGGEQVIHYVSGGMPRRWDILLMYGGCFWCILIAALLVWRRPDRPEARVLCVLLIFFSIPTLYQSGSWTSPSAQADFVISMFALIAQTMAQPLIATYAMLFARPPSMLRRALAWLAFVSAGASAALNVVACVVLWLGNSPGWLGSLGGGPTGEFLRNSPLPELFALLCLLLTIRAARNPERERVVWAALTIGPLYLFDVLVGAMYVFAPNLASGPTVRVTQATGDVLFCLLPIGIAYSLLNRRMLDLGFALNRAAVFTGVSIVIVGAFVLVEWAISDWMQRTSHSTNIIVSGALALGLGLSIRFVHTRVEHVVDNVMFRKRREDEEAVRKMAREAPYITERETLLERVEHTLTHHADASVVNVLLDDGRGRYGVVNENDPALVSLRAVHARVDLHTIETAIDGEWAYPMVARGRLVGALVLGRKRSQESYAPDESAAIAQLAHSLATALDLLSSSDERDNVGAALTALTSEMSGVQRNLQTLIALTNGGKVVG